jgi:hypothetical protein
VDLNLNRIALLTNNPEKIIAVEGPNKEVRVERRVKMIPKAWRGEVGVEGKEIGEYLKTKVLILHEPANEDYKNGSPVRFTTTIEIAWRISFLCILLKALFI